MKIKKGVHIELTSKQEKELYMRLQAIINPQIPYPFIPSQPSHPLYSIYDTWRTTSETTPDSTE